MSKWKPILYVGGLSMLAFIIYNARKRQLFPSIFLKTNLAKNYNARTIPPFGIYIKESEKDNQALIEHEMIHWKQYQEKGLLNYYFTYLKQIKQYGYDKMPMEKDARKNESEYCKDNYTECVKQGKAKTIFNPTFRE